MKDRFIRLVIIIFGLLGIYTILRVGFYISHIEVFKNIETNEILWSFARGVRFDLSAIALTNGLFILLYLIPWSEKTPKWVRTTGFAMWWGVNAFFILAGIFDLEYFRYRGKRLTPSSLQLVNEFGTSFFSSLIDYFGHWLAWFFYLWISFWAMAKVLGGETNQTSKKIGAALIFLTIAAIVMMARGGLQVKPMIIANAFKGTEPLTAQLALNSTFTLLRSNSKKSVREIQYYPDWQSLMQDLPQNDQKVANPDLKPNFVIIIVESIGQEYLGSEKHPDGFMPFLNQLSKQGFQFDDAFANGRRSIEALTTIFGGIPNLMDDPWIISDFQTNRIHGLPKILGEKGYDSTFYHGGQKGTMFFDAQAMILGFKSYLGAEDYNGEKKDFDGHWGVFDEPFLEFTAKKITEMKEPFLAGIFTLSSHYPYKIPEKYQNKFPKGTLDIHESIGYADHALRTFFSKAKTMPWWKNTIFVITGDHTSLSEDPTFQTELGLFRVPIIFYAPGIDLNLDVKKVAQHIDIMPTLLSLAGGTEMPRAHFGTNLLSPSAGAAILYSGGIYYKVYKDIAIKGKLDLGYEFYKWRSDPGFRHPKAELSNSMLKKRFKAQLQYYNNGMLEDKINW